MNYREIIRKVWAGHLSRGDSQPEYNGYRVSGVGGCLLKHLHYEDGRDKVEREDHVLNLNTGTMLHQSREEAIRENLAEFQDYCEEYMGKNLVEVHQEIQLRDEERNLVGHPDLIIEYEKYFDIIDDKYLHTFKYKKIFGRVAPSEKDNIMNYQMQIIIYAQMAEKLLGKPLRHAIIMVGRKNDLFQRPFVVRRSEVEPLIDEYWEDLAKLKENRKTFGVMPGVTAGVPYHKWECDYCAYTPICYPDG